MQRKWYVTSLVFQIMTILYFMASKMTGNDVYSQFSMMENMGGKYVSILLSFYVKLIRVTQNQYNLMLFPMCLFKNLYFLAFENMNLS